MFLLSRYVQGITCDINYDETSVYIKLLVLLFADDTVLFGSSQSELQHALNQFEKYCEEMQLIVNTTKTKVIIFTNKRNIQQSTFTFQSKALDVVTDYKYLGIYLAKNGSFTLAKKQVAEQANKALFSLLKRIKDLGLPYDLQIDIFNKTIKPILLYGSEIWGYGNCDIIERVHLKFLKYIFKLKKSTPSHMIYGELGILPITTEIQYRVITY